MPPGHRAASLCCGLEYSSVFCCSARSRLRHKHCYLFSAERASDGEVAQRAAKNEPPPCDGERAASRSWSIYGQDGCQRIVGVPVDGSAHKDVFGKGAIGERCCPLDRKSTRLNSSHLGIS